MVSFHLSKLYLKETTLPVIRQSLKKCGGRFSTQKVVHALAGVVVEADMEEYGSRSGGGE